MPIYCYDLDRFLETIDSFEEDNPDRAIAMGYLGGNYAGVLAKEEKNFKRLSDFIFPAELFADEETLDDLRDARTDLMVTGMIPSEMLATEHEGVLSYDEYRDLVCDVAEDFDEPVFLTGHFHTGRNYRMLGNADNDKPRHLASMYFPEDVFATDGCAPLQKMASGYPGTVVLEADTLTEDTRAVARGDLDSFDLDDREDDSMDADEVCETLSALSPGDRVRVNDRDRAMTVLSPEETSRIGYANSETMFLAGNGTEYRVSFAEDYPKMDWSSDSEWITSVDVVEQADAEAEKVVA